MRRRTWLLLFPSLCALSLAQTDLGAPAQPAVNRVLTGTVVNSSTNAPIPYALVQIGPEAKLTDQNGNFRFEDLAANSVYVSVHKPGFFEEREAAGGPGPMPMIALAEPITNVTVKLIPEAVISGHVEDSEGEPIEGLPVRLRHQQVVNGRSMWQQYPGTNTDEDGNFRVANIKPGTYYVEVGPNFRGRMFAGEQNQTEKAQVFPAEYYPGVRDLSSASPLRLSAGQHAAIQFGIKRVPAYRVGGVMTGIAANSGGLRLADDDAQFGNNLPVRFDAQTGRFEAFPVPAGSYRLRFQGQDTDGQPLFADVPINVNGNLNELRVPVQRTVNIPVEFETEFTKQGPEQSQTDTGQIDARRRSMYAGRAQIWLISHNPPYQQFHPSQQNGDGTMQIHGVEPGTYDVQVGPSGAAYVASVTSGGLNLLSQPLVVAPGADPQPIRVVLRDDGAALSGVVQIPDGASPAQVLMIPEGDYAKTPQPVFVDPSGKFQTQNLAPGSYDILAFDRLDGIEYSNREVLNNYLAHAAHVTLTADQQAKVTVDLIRTQQ